MHLKQGKLTYRFHNPNSVEDTADFLYRLLLEVNMGKVERAMDRDVLKQMETGVHIAEVMGEQEKE